MFVYLTFYTVRETEFVLITQFGRPLYTVSDAGLHMKWFFQTANYFDRRLHIYNPRPSEFLTRDKKNLVIESYVAWRIEDPSALRRNCRRSGAAEMRLHDIVWSGLVRVSRHARSRFDRLRSTQHRAASAAMLDSLLAGHRPRGARAVRDPRRRRPHQAPESARSRTSRASMRACAPSASASRGSIAPKVRSRR